MSKSSNQERDQIAQAAIRSCANRSISIIEKASIKSASGRYVVLSRDKSVDTPILDGAAVEKLTKLVKPNI
jgi:saccharopine dehydrogenase-like NADP-dependent oxidoreductase